MRFYSDLECFDSNIAIIDEYDNNITYRELAKLADDFAKIIKSNIRELVFIFCENKMEPLIGYIGCLRNDIVPLLLDANIDLKLAEKLIKLYKPSYIYIPEMMHKSFDDTKIVSANKNYILKQTNFNVTHKLNENLALLLTTSGSTGSPKLVRQSADNICSNAQSIAEYLEITEKEMPITSLPMNYTYGLSVINSHLTKGATILLTNKSIVERAFWDLLKKYRATSLAGVPYTYEILKKIRFFRMNLPTLKTLTQAGGKLGYDLTEEIGKYCKRNNMKFFVMYGQTEATARMGYLPWQYAISKCGSMGVAIPGGKFWLEDNGHIIQKSNVSAELVYKGPNVTLGYAESIEDLALGDENNGVLKTGDIAKIDEDGFYYIVGRIKRFIKIFGNRVNLDEVEQLLKSKGYECACGGKDDKMTIAVVNCANEKELKNYIATKLKFSLTAFKIISVNEIPKNESGKTLYSKLFKEE
ncbi:AMP-binding protein [Tepidibacter sp. Z1-5]|uniref:AMP-binding protein n=1 Tax=Tepidibacter sp. Z1-5 TaxID=3134138 RepID=UPI0030BB3E00